MMKQSPPTPPPMTTITTTITDTTTAATVAVVDTDDNVFSPISNAFFIGNHNTTATSSSTTNINTTNTKAITPRHSQLPPPPQEQQREPLPVSHDNSWIGARLSPITSTSSRRNKNSKDGNVVAITVENDSDDTDNDDENDGHTDDDNDDDIATCRYMDDPTIPPPPQQHSGGTNTGRHIFNHQHLKYPHRTNNTKKYDGTVVVSAPPVNERTKLLLSSLSSPPPPTLSSRRQRPRPRQDYFNNNNDNDPPSSSSLPYHRLQQRRPLFVVNGSIQNDIPQQSPPAYHYPQPSHHQQEQQFDEQQVNGTHDNNNSRNPQSQQRQQNHHHHHHSTNSIHPLWKSSPPSNSNSDNDRNYHNGVMPIMHLSNKSMSIGYINRIAIAIGTLSGLIVINMAIMDHRMNRLYQQWNNTLPYLHFSTSAMVRFGALSPDVVINNHILTSSTSSYGSSRPPTWFDYIQYMNEIIVLRPYLQCVTSVLMCTSVLEWFIVVMAWMAMVRIATITTPILTTIPTHSPHDTEATTTSTTTTTFPTWYQIVGCYVISAWTGQLWFFAFNAPNAIVGCVSWGTCGTLCMIGMIRPQYRFELFLFAALLVILSYLLLPYSSVYGTTMSALFGWSMASCGYNGVEQKQPGIIYVGNSNDLRGRTSITFIGTAGMVLLVTIPVLSLAFQKQ